MCRASFLHTLRNRQWEDPRVIQLLSVSGLLPIFGLTFCQYDQQLMMAFIERWRPETHTFILPNGEMTVTLEDVTVLTGLPVNGTSVIGRTDIDWRNLCVQLLGIEPTRALLKGQYIGVGWLDGNFLDPDPNSPQEYIE